MRYINRRFTYLLTWQLEQIRNNNSFFTLMVLKILNEDLKQQL